MPGPPASPPRIALVAGGTGLVGGHLLRRLVEAPAYGRTLAFGRRAPSFTHERLEPEIGVDFAKLEERPAPSIDPSAPVTAFSALGTTIRAAGSPAAFRAIDHDAALAFARFAKRTGAETFVLVSSVGAATGARNNYLRVKGELEEAVTKLGFSTLLVLRPSLLLGPREERRPGERIAQTVMPLFAPLMAGPLARYRPIDAKDVAGAMVKAGLMANAGHVVWEHADILQHARG